MAEYIDRYPVTKRQRQLLRAFANPHVRTMGDLAKKMGVETHCGLYKGIWALIKKGMLGQDPLKVGKTGSYYVTAAGRRFLRLGKEAENGSEAAQQHRGQEP